MSKKFTTYKISKKIPNYSADNLTSIGAEEI